MELGTTPWVDSAWSTFAPRLQAVGYDMRRLPEMHSISPMSVREYGAGNWGVVSPTTHRHVVVKLTQDKPEALLVSMILGQKHLGFPGIGQPPRGIVRYDDVLQLKHEKHNGKEIFVIWRSEAKDIGSALKGAIIKNEMIVGGNSAAMTTLMPITRMTSVIRFLWMDIVELRKRTPDDARYVAMLDVIWRHAQTRTVSSHGSPHSPGSLARITDSLRQLWNEIDDAKRDPISAPIADAFEYFLSRGVLLADVHWNNIGRDVVAPYPWIITDPGHAVILDTTVRIPPVESV